jgi:hypothetical protein
MAYFELFAAQRYVKTAHRDFFENTQLAAIRGGA